MAARVPRRQVDGVLLLDKPVGISSNAALQRAKRLYAAEKAGHTGTLDPLASGLLPIVLGEATKFSQYLLDADKRYLAAVRFGEATDTGDAEGEVIERVPVDFVLSQLLDVLASMTGRQQQVPPMHSALKHHGRPYYDYARRGEVVPREARDVDVHALRLVEWSPPLATIDVTCSKGTYVRVLAEDLGRTLGGVAHLAGLRRSETGGFDLAQAVTLDALERMTPAARDDILLPPEVLVAHLPQVELDAASATRLRHGLVVESSCRAHGPVVCRGDDGRVIGLGTVEGKRLRPLRLMRTA